MVINNTSIKGLNLITPNINNDERGYFMEAFKSSFIKKINSNITFIQDNESHSKFGVLRGLHFQNPPFDQTKLIRVIRGKILDIAVDLRKDSKTFGKYESFIISSKNKRQLFIPNGFAHGFLTLSKKATILYKVDKKYSKSHESGIIFNDIDLNINWNLKNIKNISISSKDKKLMTFKEYIKRQKF